MKCAAGVLWREMKSVLLSVQPVSAPFVLGAWSAMGEPKVRSTPSHMAWCMTSCIVLLPSAMEEAYEEDFQCPLCARPQWFLRCVERFHLWSAEFSDTFTAWSIPTPKKMEGLKAKFKMGRRRSRREEVFLVPMVMRRDYQGPRET